MIVRLSEKLMAGGFIVLLPFFVMPGFGGDMDMQFRAPKLWGLFLFSNLLFAAFAGRRLHWSIGLAHATVSLLTLVTGFGATQLYAFTYWSAGLAFCLWAIDPCYAESAWDREILIYRCFAIGGILCAAHGLAQYFGFTWPLHFAPGIAHNSVMSFMGQSTKLGSFLAPVMGICFALNWVIPGVFVGAVALLTGSSFTALSLGAVILVCAKHWWGKAGLKRLVLAGAVGVAIFGLLAPAQFREAADDKGRVRLWRETLGEWRKAPWFGYGPGSFQKKSQDALLAWDMIRQTDKFARELGPKAPQELVRQRAVAQQYLDAFFQSRETRELHGVFFQAHNEFVNVLHDGGLVGAAALLVVLACVVLAYRKTWWSDDWLLTPDEACAQVSLAALAANSLGNFPMQLEPQHLLAMFSLAILLRAARA